MRTLNLFMIGVVFVLIVWKGVPLAVSGAITVGDFTVFNMYLFRLVWPLIALGYVVNLYHRGMASLKCMNAIFSLKHSIGDWTGVIAWEQITGYIKIHIQK